MKNDLFILPWNYFVMFQEVMDVDDHLLHTTEVVVAEAAEIIVLDLALIHPVSRNTFFNIHWVITVPIILIDVYLIVYFLFYASCKFHLQLMERPKYWVEVDFASVKAFVPHSDVGDQQDVDLW